MVTNALQPMQTVTGSDVVSLGAMLAQIAAEQQLAYQGQAGYYNPNAFSGGMAGYLPTLDRELGLGQLGVQQGNLAVNQQNANTNRDLGFGNLALGKDQLAAAMRDADRQFGLDVQRFGLEQAQFNYQQRLGEAQTRLQQLGLLSSLRGPADFLAYNYTLNNMAAPPGQADDPFQLTAGMNQPYAAPPLPPTPPFTPTDPNSLPGANRPAPSATGAAAPTQATTTAPTNALATQPAPARQAPASTTAISGNPASDAALRQQWVNQGAPPEVLAEFERISQNMNNAYATQVANTGGNPGYARGGMSPGGMAMVGDSKSGKETGHEELVISDGPFMVLPNEVLEMLQEAHGGDVDRAAFGGMFEGMSGSQPSGGGWGQGMQQRYRDYERYANTPQGPASIPQTQPVPPQTPARNPWEQDARQYHLDRINQWKQQGSPRMGQWGQGGLDSIRQWLGQNGPASIPRTQPVPPQTGAGGPQNMDSIRQWLEQMWGRIPRAATGGFFNFNVHSPQDTANAPFIQKAIGNQPSAAWQARGEPLGAVGRRPFNYANYLQLAPSEQDMFRGLVETPSAMGGYGGYWQDELERSRRSSFQGQTNSPAVYG